MAGRSRAQMRKVLRRWLPTATWAVFGVVLIAVATAMYGQIRFGTPAAPLALARGERVQLQPAVCSLGECGRREERDIRVTVFNFSDAPARVVGGTADCTCVSIKALPLAVARRRSTVVPVKVRLGAIDGPFEQTLSLYIDPGDGSGLQTLQSVIKAEVRGRQ